MSCTCNFGCSRTRLNERGEAVPAAKDYFQCDLSCRARPVGSDDDEVVADYDTQRQHSQSGGGDAARLPGISLQLSAMERQMAEGTDVDAKRS